MNTVTRLLVDKRHIEQTRIETIDAQALASGQARMKVERVGLTANNITYAATGESLRYWQFFPADEAWGCVPAWGFATVAESQAQGLEVGERIWGFWPMASALVVEPTKLTPFGFTDGVAHRSMLPAIYNQYQRSARDPMHHDGQEDAESILRPMFTTAWFVDDFLADNNCFGADTMVLSSASSKTAYGTAFQLFKRGGVKIVGLTSARNKAFVEALGCYHEVLDYDQVETLDPQAAAVYLDYAGSVAIRRRVHVHLKQLRYSSSIGAAHVNDFGPAGDLPGPRPVFLFVPTQAAKRIGEWGGLGLTQRMGQDWQRFVTRVLDASDPWLQVQQHHGPAAWQAAYARVLSGAGDPRSGHMLVA